MGFAFRSTHPPLRAHAPTRRLDAHADRRFFLFTMSNSAVFFVPSARSCARVLPFSFAPAPNEGWAERRQARCVVGRACEARTSTPSEARRVPRAAGRSPLGAPPWRFSAGVRASISGISSGSVQRAPRSRVVMPGGRGPRPPESDGYEPRPRDATPRSAFGIVSRRRPS